MQMSHWIRFISEDRFVDTGWVESRYGLLTLSRQGWDTDTERRKREENREYPWELVWDPE